MQEEIQLSIIKKYNYLISCFSMFFLFSLMSGFSNQEIQLFFMYISGFSNQEIQYFFPFFPYMSALRRSEISKHNLEIQL